MKCYYEKHDMCIRYRMPCNHSFWKRCSQFEDDDVLARSWSEFSALCCLVLAFTSLAAWTVVALVRCFV